MMNTAEVLKSDPPAPNPVTEVGGKNLEQFMARPGDPLSEAFERKFTIHAGAEVKPLPPEEAARVYGEITAEPTGRALGLYLHIPFCHNQCLYCGFAGKPPEKDLCAAYARALISEIEWLGARGAAKAPVQVIYLGGGTPSALAPELLAEVAGALRNNFDLANDCEMTLEGRLHDFTPERSAGFLEAGFNRFSIGVQSFQTEVRKSLGRISDRPTVVKYLESLVSRGKAAVIIDLIYGLPGQTPDDFVEDLKIAEAIGVDGLDTYQLNIFPSSRLAKAIQEGRLPSAAPLNKQGQYYRQASEYLLGRRWRQLSLSHFAQTSRERNLYNPWAKQRRDCLAIGAGAGGFLSGWSFYRMPAVEKYLADAEKGFFVPSILSAPHANNEMNSFITGQMERGYLNHRRLADEFSINPEPLKTLMGNWADNGLAVFDNEWMTLTLSGRFWGVNLTQAIIETAGLGLKH